jgi:ribonucleotide monophosphatase NagD (HAD superfamily)
MAGLVRDMCPGVDVADMVMVGDRDDTDGAFARTLGCRFALVLSGVTQDGNDVRADIVAPSLAGVVQQLLTP